MLKEYLKYVSLNIFSMIGVSIYILADTFFISKGLGAAGLAALNIALPVYNVINGFALMAGIGGASQLLLHYDDTHQKNTVFSTTVISFLVLGITISIIGIFFHHYIAALLGANSEIIDNASIYIKVLCIFAPMFILNQTIQSLVKNDGFPALAMTSTIVGCTFNIIFDYIFIFILKLGMFGAVLATGFAPVVGLCILSLHFVKHKNTFHFVPKFKVQTLLSTISSGIPSFVLEMAGGIVMFDFNILILQLTGNNGVAAYGILANILIVVAAVYNGIGQGSQTMLGRMYSHHDYNSLKKVLRYAFVVTTIVSIIFYIISLGLHESIVEIFNSEHNIIMANLANDGFVLFFSQCFFYGMNTVMIMYFVCIDRSNISQILSLLKGFILIIPVSFLLSKLWQMSGIWMTTTVVEIITLLLSFYYLHKSPL